MYDGIKATPEIIALDTGTWQSFFFNKTVQGFCYLQAVTLFTFSHFLFIYNFTFDNF